MNTSSLKIPTTEVVSFDILEIADKTSEYLAQLFENGDEVHLCFTHRDLHSALRLDTVRQSCGIVIKSILSLAQKHSDPDYQTLLQINEGVTGYLEESINQFKNVSKSEYVQMDIRLTYVQEPGKPMSLNTKTSFIDTQGNYKALNEV